VRAVRHQQSSAIGPRARRRKHASSCVLLPKQLKLPRIERSRGRKRTDETATGLASERSVRSTEHTTIDAKTGQRRLPRTRLGRQCGCHRPQWIEANVSLQGKCARGARAREADGQASCELQEVARRTTWGMKLLNNWTRTKSGIQSLYLGRDRQAACKGKTACFFHFSQRKCGSRQPYLLQMGMLSGLERPEK
jgi:hypothetical protein